LRRTPIITRILRDSLLLDPRTVLEEQEQEVLQALSEEVSRDAQT
jgi:L-seryl-tRNA(Ser) seleniumtransferase